MQAVILAAGKGTRMGHLTIDTPKSLLRVHNRTLIEHVIQALPGSVSELIVVIDYLGNQIRDQLGTSFSNRKVVFIEQTAPGTGGALLSARPYLDSAFMVVNSDDIYTKNDLERLVLEKTPSQGIVQRVRPSDSAESIVFNKEGRITGRIKVKPQSLRWLGTGAFFLNKMLWQEEFVRLGNGEYSIPHTVAKASFRVQTVAFTDWLPVNTPDELLIAEKWLTQT